MQPAETPSDCRLPQAERLKGKKDCQELFSKGSSVFSYPFKVLYRFDVPPTANGLPRLLVAVPKRSFKRAHDRNLLKRQIREAYRLRKADIFAGRERVPGALGLVYVGKAAEPYAKIGKRLAKALELLYSPEKRKGDRKGKRKEPS